MRFREPSTLRTSSVSGAGRIVGKTGWCLDRDWRAHAIVYITAGGGWYRDADGTSATVGEGDVLVLFPGLIHSYGPHPGRTWTEVWIGFHGPVFAALEHDGILDRSRPVWHPGLDDALIARCESIITAVDRSGGPSDAALVARLHHLLVDLRAAEATGARPSLAARARAELERDLRRPVDLRALARRLGVGYDTLRRAFHAETGTSPGRWRLLRRIERVKEAMSAGATLDEAAAASGFCDRFFLSRQFKRVVGQTPGAWRRGIFGTTRKPPFSDLPAD